MKRNFEDIFNEWNGITKTTKKKNKAEIKMPNTKKEKNIMEIGLSKYGIHDKDMDSTDNDYQHRNFKKAVSRKKLRDMAPQSKIDLHGMTISEAEQALEFFFENSKQNGLKKILIVHGKGNHSKQGPVLKNFVKKYLESQKLAGESGYSKNSEGSTGSTWVILK